MATTHDRNGSFALTWGYVGNVALAGLIAGVLMGAIMHEVMGIMQAVGALYTFETTVHGWGFHLFHSMIFGVIFGGVFLWARFDGLRDRVLPSTALGIAWALALWLVAAGVVMPLWLGVVGAPAPDVPAWNPWSGVGHVVYGTVLGAGAAVLHGRADG